MSSQDSIPEILSSIVELSSDNVTEKLDEIIPLLVSYLQQCGNNTVLQLKCLQAMLVTSLPCISIDRADSLLLQHAVPATKQLFLQEINDITVILQGDVDTIVQDVLLGHIQVCQDLLDCLCSTTHYIASLCSVDCILVQSVPGNVSLVLAEAFKHCRQSESLYGAMFQELHDVLTALFQKCCQLQTHFLAAMTSVIKFNCFFEDELVLLTEVLESMSEIGELASALDVKAMVDVWKGYTQLAEAYCEHLKPRLDVAKPIISLSQQIVTSLEATVCLSAGESKLITRNIKVISFQLKVVLKLCEQYADYLGDCHKQLVLLLVSLYRLSGCGLQLTETDAQVIEVVDRHAGIAAEPLVTSLMSDVSFVQNYFKAADTKESNGSFLGIALLSIAVLKKLIHADSNTRKMWLNDESNILDCVFQLTGHLHSELTWPLQIPGVMSRGEPQRMVDLYEYLVTHLAGFIMSVSVKEFPAVERVLLENVLQTSAWKALLAIDLWCIVARYGSAELCFQHVCRLSAVVEQMPSMESRPERAFLVSLLNRLFPLLSSKHLDALHELFPIPQHLDIWTVIQPTLVSPGVAQQLQKHFTSSMEAWLMQPLSAENYKAMVRSLSVVASCVAVIPPNTGMMTEIMTLWHTVENIITQQENYVSAHWLQHLIFLICEASIALLPHMNNHQLFKVLSGMKTLAAVRCSSVKISVVLALRKLGDKFIDVDANQADVFHVTAELFSLLLKDNNILVLEATLEAFEYFAHVTQHAEIVAASVQDDEAIQLKVANYLKRILPCQEPSLNLKQYLCHQSRVMFVHKCCIQSINGSTQELQLVHESMQELQPVKKFKIDTCEDVKKIIQQYLGLSEQIVSFILHKKVSSNEIEKLKKIATEILKFSDEN